MTFEYGSFGLLHSFLIGNNDFGNTKGIKALSYYNYEDTANQEPGSLGLSGAL